MDREMMYYISAWSWFQCSIMFLIAFFITLFLFESIGAFILDIAFFLAFLFCYRKGQSRFKEVINDLK